MPVTGTVFVDKLPGHVRIRIEGDDPSHPWAMVLTPQAAFNLGLELRVKAEDAGHEGNATSITTSSGMMPQRRPPSNVASFEGQAGPNGPQRQRKGGSGPTPPPVTPPDDLLGDSF